MVTARLPLPVAALLRRAQNARSPKERHDAAYFAWEASVRIGAAIVEHAEPDKLARPSTGYWVSALRGRDDQIRETSLLDLLVWFEWVLPQGARSRPASMARGRLFDAIPAYRNRVIAHGSVKENDFYEAGARRMIDALLAAWDLGLFLPPLATLVYVDAIEIDPEGIRRARILSLMGDAVSLEPDSRSALPGDALPGRVYVRSGDRYLSAHPILLFVESQANLLFLNGRGRRARYLDYVTSSEIGSQALEAQFPAVERDLDAIGAPREEEGGGRAEPGEDPPPPIVDENVQFTVYRPRSVEAETWVPLLAFAHLSELPPDADPNAPDPLEQVKALAEQALGERASAYASVSQDSALALPREGEITFVPELPGITVNPPRRAFLWVEHVHQEQFRIRARRDLAGKTVRGRMSVLFGSILLAEVRLTINVEREVAVEPPLEPTSARRFRRIFASHAPEDQSVISEFQRYAALMGDQFVTGWSNARAGEQWSAEMERTIGEADVFQLFWSTNAMRSPVVLNELDYAMSLARPEFIRPVYWQEPLPRNDALGLPPAALLDTPFLKIGTKVAEPAPIELGTAPRPMPLPQASPVPPPAPPIPGAAFGAPMPGPPSMAPPPPMMVEPAGPAGSGPTAPEPALFRMDASSAPLRSQKRKAGWMWVAGPVLAVLLLFVVLPGQLLVNARSGDVPLAGSPPPPAPALGIVEVVVEGAEGAVVFIDGVERGVAPLRVELPQGRHVVVVRRSGLERREEIEIVAGEQRTVTFGAE